VQGMNGHCIDRTVRICDFICCRSIQLH
jgi:hypothetical protein